MDNETVKIESFRELRVYQNSIELAEDIYEITKAFPEHEQYSMTDQIRRSSRSVSANIGEAWYQRAYKDSFLSKLNTSLSESAETQVWLELANSFDYITESEFDTQFDQCDKIISQLVKMCKQPEKWVKPQ